MFYRWKSRDFTTIAAYELEEGDEIAYGHGGGNLKYGTVKIESITRVPGVGLLLQYTLPVGAMATSSPVNTITIHWDGNRPRINISQEIDDFYRPVLVRRR